jgi:hypothetical protein
MFKYRNTGKYTFLIEVNDKLISVKPHQEFLSDKLLDHPWLLELNTRPQEEKKEIKKIVKPVVKKEVDEIKLDLKPELSHDSKA